MASFLDFLPVASQIKSAIQAASGDLEGAKNTQENFSRQCPVISQARSFVEATALQNPEAARETQEQFLNGFIEPLADNTPVIGHIKGGIHMAVGDTKRGEEILKGASKTLAIALGSAAGPVGATSSAYLYDSIVTAIDSAVKGEHTPYGMHDYFENIDEKTVGDHFDFWLEAALSGIPAGQKKAMKQKIIAKVTETVKNRVARK